MKRSGKLLFLTGVAVLVLIAAIFSSQRQEAVPELERATLFPAFRYAVNEAGTIALRSGGRTLTIARNADQWLIAEADNYPADLAKIRKLLLEVVDLKVIEEKTSNPERYATLGVQDPTADQTESTALEIKDAKGDQQVSLIVGKRQLSGAAGGNPGRYVRLAGKEQSLLVTGPLDAPADVASWLVAEVLNIDPARVGKVRIEHPDSGKVELNAADNGDMILANLPEGKEAKAPTVLNRMKDVLQNIRIENVMRGDAAALPAPHTVTTIGTVDGLIVRVESGAIKDTTWVSFNFEYDPASAEAAHAAKTADAAKGDKAIDAKEDDAAVPEKSTLDVKKEVAELQLKTAGWLFKLPDYQLELLTRTLDKLSQDKVADGEKQEG
jgi:hypothetical protein